MRKPRNLSRIYYRHLNAQTGKWENWCFEDLPPDEQFAKVKNATPEYLVLITALADTIKRLGDECEIVRDDEDGKD